MNFGSDNATAVSEPIWRAMTEANQGAATAYGNDEITRRLDRIYSDLFETEVAVFPVATGTAANALALSVMAPPYGAIYCHQNAHIEEDECGAPEFYTGGAKVVPIPGPEGRITADQLAQAVTRYRGGVEHHVQAAAVSLTQATEWGTVYRSSDVALIADVAGRYGLPVHMDGARFANALAFLECSPADATWRAGVDVLSFGATKNGAMAAEAVIFFKPDAARDIVYRRKRGGHLVSKMRYLSAQLEAYVADGHWLDNARHANAMAKRLADGLAAVPGARLVCPVEANEVFVQLVAEIAESLLQAGFFFHPWRQIGEGGYRLVTAFDTRPEDVDRLLEAAAQKSDELAAKTA